MMLFFFVEFWETIGEHEFFLPLGSDVNDVTLLVCQLFQHKIF